MQRPELGKQRLIFLFLMAVLVLNPPFLTIFDIPRTLLGVPVLYIYLFACWATLIALAAIAIESTGEDKEEEGDAAPEEAASSAPDA